MESFTKGSVVLIPFPFPFSDLSNAKIRPAVVVAVVDKSDFILCQITSNPYSDPRAIQLIDNDFLNGSLQRVSFVRPAKLFTANNGLVIKRIGQLTEAKSSAIIDSIVQIMRG